MQIYLKLQVTKQPKEKSTNNLEHEQMPSVNIFHQHILNPFVNVLLGHIGNHLSP
jgi:hypothetical protein